MQLEAYRHIHLVGIGGVGMRAIAHVLLQRGAQVSGSDNSPGDFVETLRAAGATIYTGHSPQYVSGADLVVVSTAIRADNVEVLAAKEAGIPVVHRSDIVTALMNEGKGIAVAGAHGKTTTTSMIGQVLEESALDPTIIIGGEVAYLRGNSKRGRGEWVLAEADESDGSFLKLHPYIAVVTNIEDDHLDYYGSLEKIRETFAEFLAHVHSENGLAVLCTENENIRELLPQMSCPYTTYGFSSTNDYYATDIHYLDGRLHFRAHAQGKEIGEIVLQVPGHYNVLNALAALAVGTAVGLEFAEIAAALRHFTGTKRRFQTLLKNDTVWLVDDYAHHPTEIKAALKAAKDVAAQRVICAFQPHRYTRTRLLQDEFADAFRDADIVIFTDIYAAGEDPLPGVDGALLPKLAAKYNADVRYVPDVTALPSYLRKLARPGDLLITMGAGDICRSAYRLAAEWK